MIDSTDTCPALECCPNNPFGYLTPPPPQDRVSLTLDNSVTCSTCYNEAYENRIAATGLGLQLTWTITEGELPPGLTFHGGYNELGYVIIDGTPTTAGHYEITVQAESPNGTIGTGTFSLNVVQITTTSLPDYVVGEAYRAQLEADGGSGNYGWSLTSGALPDGLILDPTNGVISGTPTGSNAGDMPLVFNVADLTCEEFNPVFTPIVSLVTSSNTSVATIFGYPEYPGHASSPPKKYHKLTWSGEATQIGNWSFSPETFEWYLDHGVPETETQMCNCKYVYSGTAEIDSHGNQISNYSKDFYASCPAFTPNFDTNLFSFPTTLAGYCWKYDPGCCPTCNDPPPFIADRQLNSPTDIPIDLVSATVDAASNGVVGSVTTPTTYTNTAAYTLLIHLQHGGFNGVNNFPQATWNGIQGPWPYIATVYNISAILSDEYTDAEALANAVHTVGGSRRAENFPRTTGFVSRSTAVNYDLNASNLVIGGSYIITVVFQDSDFTRTSRAFPFIATAATNTINSEVPTPAPGHTITIMQPTIAFA